MRATHRIVALAATTALLPFLPPGVLIVALLVAMAVTAAVARAPRAAIAQSVWRLRWLLAAVVLVYAFLSPGDGFRWFDAVARGAVLVCAVVAVQLALHGLPAAELASALSRVLAPLTRVGIRSERFAHRLALTLDAVPEVQALIARTPAPQSGRPWERLAGRAAAVVAAIEAEPAR